MLLPDSHSIFGKVANGITKRLEQSFKKDVNDIVQLVRRELNDCTWKFPYSLLQFSARHGALTCEKEVEHMKSNGKRDEKGE